MPSAEAMAAYVAGPPPGRVAARRPRRVLAVLLSWLAGLALAPPAVAAPRSATPPSSIRAAPGFTVELVRSAQDGEDSWISMTFDDRGRVIVGLDQKGVARLAPPPTAGGAWTFARLDESLAHCRGVLFHAGSLYVNATDAKELWRFDDPGGDGTFPTRTLLSRFDYRSRYGHGQNQLVAGPDGAVYSIVGNDVSFPEGVSPASPYRDPHVDRLLADPADAGHDDRVGYLLRISGEVGEWRVVAGGFRNQVDADWNDDGEWFTWDADMEWDVGQPWYRPTRLNHVVSGAEYGWRWGTMKWPPYYPDSLPATLETGLGSPTGVVFGRRGGFPGRWREALYMADWQHGRILAAFLTPAGATYTATDELFVEGAPLNVCDMAFGPDGALWFITGGRRSQSGLYRVAFTGDAATVPPAAPVDPAVAAAGRAARARRRALEAYANSPWKKSSGRFSTDENLRFSRELRSRDRIPAIEQAVYPQPAHAAGPAAGAAHAAGPAAGAAHAAGPAAGAVGAAIADLWPDLGGPDRSLRSAARVALERQPLASWRERARAERDPLARGEALLAWMRVADAAERPDVVRAVLAGEPTAGEAETLLVLRALAIALARGTDIASADLERLQGLVDRVDRQFDGPLDSRLGGQPAAAVQREIVELLVAARCHDTVERLLDRLDRADSQEDQIHCVHALARWAGPWNVAEHRRLLAWFARARNFRGGHLLPKILARMQEDVLRTVGDEERPALAAELAALDAPADAPAVSAAPLRPLVRAWTAAELEPELSRALAPRDAAAGRRALAAASCLACHRFGGAGSAVGPDLSAVGRRFDLRTLVASILEPSQVVDPKYHGTTWVLASGRSLTGRAAQVNAQEITIEVDPLTGRTEKVPRDEIESAHPSAVSPMPAGLVDVLTLDEILDLLALLRAGAG